jgi:hypothetical protein
MARQRPGNLLGQQRAPQRDVTAWHPAIPGVVEVFHAHLIE